MNNLLKCPEMQAGNHCPIVGLSGTLFTILRLKSQTLDRHIDHENDWPVETGRNYNLIWWKIKNGYRCSLLTGTHMHPETCVRVCARCVFVWERKRKRREQSRWLSGPFSPSLRADWLQIGKWGTGVWAGKHTPYTSISSAHNFCDHRNSASGKTEEFNNAFYKCSQ